MCEFLEFGAAAARRLRRLQRARVRHTGAGARRRTAGPRQSRQLCARFPALPTATLLPVSLSLPTSVSHVTLHVRCRHRGTRERHGVHDRLVGQHAQTLARQSRLVVAGCAVGRVRPARLPVHQWRAHRPVWRYRFHL